MTRKQRSYIFSVILLGVTIYTVWPKEKDPLVSNINGVTMGTIGYNVKVVGGSVDVKPQIDSLLEAFNQSLSTYIQDSEISKFNKNSEVENPSRLFQHVLSESHWIYEQTHGAFDPTVGPLVKAWGFGPDKQIIEPDSAAIDSMLLLIGYEKLEFSKSQVKKEAKVTLDFSAIAKGQAVDEIGQFLEGRGITNYMVEIGGEVRCRGLNQNDTTWMIGIQDPRIAKVDTKAAVVAVDNRSVATSGNYRNYYEKDGKIRAHIVDPITGYTAKHDLLSVTVLHANCMTADAYATAFMVMGLEKSIAHVEGDPELEALFVFNSGDVLDVYVSGGISDQVTIVLQ